MNKMIVFSTKLEANYSLVRCREECELNYVGEKYYPEINNQVLERVSTEGEHSIEQTIDFVADPNISNIIAIPAPQSCSGVYITEIFSYYNQDASERFVELYNSTAGDIDLSSCSLSYKNKKYTMSGILASNDYYAYHDIPLTKNPSSVLFIDLNDYDGDRVDSVSYYHGQKQGVSYSLFVNDGNSE